MERIQREIVAEATKQAEKSVKEEKIKWLKDIILQTLEKIEKVKKARQEADEELEILEKDIKDLKLGRMDLIEERQRLYPKAKEISVIVIEKPQPREHHTTIINNTPIVIHETRDRWYQPWTVYNHCTSVPMNFTSGIAAFATLQGDNCIAFTATNSLAKDGVPGTYCLNNGNVVSL